MKSTQASSYDTRAMTTQYAEECATVLVEDHNNYGISWTVGRMDMLEGAFGRTWFFCKCKPKREKDCEDVFTNRF